MPNPLRNGKRGVPARRFGKTALAAYVEARVLRLHALDRIQNRTPAGDFKSAVARAEPSRLKNEAARAELLKLHKHFNLDRLVR